MSCSSNHHYDKVFVVSSVGIKRIECIDRPFLPGTLNRTSTNSADLEETARIGDGSPRRGGSYEYPQSMF